MARFKLSVQFIGTHYCGWQRQPKGLSVQEAIETVLEQYFQVKIRLMPCGRTDSGVHALMHVCHFDVPDENIHLKAGVEKKLFYALDGLLPDDIAPLELKLVESDFHANLDAQKKEYVYLIYNSRHRDVFLSPYTWRIPYDLSIKKMREAARLLEGEHDFGSFCGKRSKVKSTVRTLNKISIKRVHELNIPIVSPWSSVDRNEGSIIELKFLGEGFLKQMVRNIVGTLSDVGRGNLQVSDMKRILKAQERKMAGQTAPAKGLILSRVYY